FEVARAGAEILRLARPGTIPDQGLDENLILATGLHLGLGALLLLGESDGEVDLEQAAFLLAAQLSARRAGGPERRSVLGRLGTGAVACLRASLERLAPRAAALRLQLGLPATAAGPAGWSLAPAAALRSCPVVEREVAAP